jgi:hypothetical protein
MQRRADGTLPQQDEMIGGAVLDRAARIRCPVVGFTLETISKRRRRLLHRLARRHVTPGAANHSRREIAALGGRDPGGETLSGWSDGFRGSLDL